MLIFKVMVCFLVVFTNEDCVGGLPSIQDSPDNHEAGQSARSASNQGVANEPGNRPSEVLDYAERGEEDVRGKIVKMNPRGVLSAKFSSVKFEEELAPRLSSARKGTDRMSKFQPDAQRKNENVRGDDASRKGSSGTDQFVDKSKSRNDEATSSEFPTSSPGARGTRRFSSVYAMVDLDEKVNKKKQEFKNDLSAYLTDVLDTVVGGKASANPQSSDEDSKKGDPDTAEKVDSQNPSKNPENQTAGNLLSEKTNNVPVPEDEANVSSGENRQRKSLGDAVTWHQQSTNMRPTRTQHLVQNKRSTGEGTLRLPGYGGRRSTVKNPRAVQGGGRVLNRRHYIADGSSSPRGNQLQFVGVNPLQVNAAAMAYSSRQQTARALNVDLSRALYQFGPAQLNALRGVFDNVPPATQNFKPIAPKQVAYVPPRIVYEAKIVPTPFMPFRTEQKTVDALSALLGQNPAQQLEGLNLILRKDIPESPEVKTSPVVSSGEISRQGIHDGVALSQAFVTPIPSIDINSGLDDGSFRFSHDPNEESDTAVGGPFDQREPPRYTFTENIRAQENPYKTIPIVEEPEESPSGQPVVEKETHTHPVWNGVADIQEETRDENEGRYSQHNENEQGTDHGDAYAANYNFGYHVKDYESGNNFGHQETRDGVITNGRYHVLLPDGRLQNVNYHVDEGGYHAKVSYQLNPSV